MTISNLIRKRQKDGVVESRKAVVSQEVATVLLVDDDDAVRGFAQLALAGSGYRVFTCSTGEEALLLESECAGTIDLLLADIVMPDLSGIEVAKLLVARRPGVKTILMSGYPPENFALDVTLCHAFLAKPFLVGALLSTIRTVLDGQRSAQKAVTRVSPARATRPATVERINSQPCPR